jgi:short-subunit dehydrogenase
MQALEKTGGIDVLINNGGISQRSLTWETPLEVDDRIFSINYFAAVILTKAVLPGMMERGGGAIAATSSITGKFGFPLRSAYAASKHAVHGFFETLGIELADQNISVTVAIPGRVRTNISVNALTSTGEKHGKMDPGQAGGISPERCARKYLDAIHRGKREVFIGGKELMMAHIRRFLPSLFFRLARKIDPA